MKKKMLILFFTLPLALSASACSTQPASETVTQNDASAEQVDPTNEAKQDAQQNAKQDAKSNQEEATLNADASAGQTEDTAAPGTFEALEAAVMNDVLASISSLTGEMEALAADIDSFDKYVENAHRVEAFYDSICTESLRLEICLMEHAAVYAEFIMNSDKDFDDKYDDLDKLFDVVYDDAGDEFFDEIYDGILEEMYDIFYDELLDDAYDDTPYKEWLDVHSNEYDWWLDARSDCYEIWLDTRSDIYEFWLDLRSAAFEKDADEAADIIADFKEDIEDLKTDLQK